MNLNKVFLIGRLTKDPETKTLPSGQLIARFGLATDRFYFDKDKNKKQDTEFHNIVLFGKSAEIASQYLNKGSLVMIEGRLKTRKWEDAQKIQHSKTEIICEKMQLGPKSASRSAYQPEIKEEKKSISEEIPVIDEELASEETPF